MNFVSMILIGCFIVMAQAVSLRTFAKNRRLPNWLKNQKRQFNNYHNRHLGKGMKNRRNLGNFHFAQDLSECSLIKNTDGRLLIDCEDHFQALLSDIIDEFTGNGQASGQHASGKQQSGVDATENQSDE